MSNSVKVLLYVVLALVASVSGYFALTSFGQMMERAADRTSELEQIERVRTPPPEPEPAVPEVNQETPPATVDTNTLLEVTNAASGVITNTNAAASEPLEAEATAQATNVSAAPKEPELVTALGASPRSEGRRGRLGLWIGLFVVSLIGLGLLIASDVSHYLGNRALNVLYNEDAEGIKNPEYEKAEEVWANGDHLEAIRMMRDYLARNPREQHVAIRIAEIYEKDLKNNLAAALEYEEVLKHKLPAERWGWAAIHLCNLYFRLNQEAKGYDLLRRIVNDYPNTAAAEKARKRLEQVDGSSLPIESAGAAAEPDPAPPEPPPGASSNLPPGFRPRK